MSVINVSSFKCEAYESAQETVVAAISICHSRPDFPLENAKQWRIALNYINRRISRNINMLSGRCAGGNLVYPVMDAALTSEACEVAEGTLVKLDNFRVVARRLAESVPKSGSHEAELREMGLRLKKEIQIAKGRVGL
ncbi:hypothetical protein QFC21_006057 [Naganishia friedmannii]|uniref:Uncharacterized protein n=1 Tax=Naganishia friedmannii TaxID=89922 RepID=A0ACC2V5U9_9TREE|nr:hypothetical protein QFC21_006057 [Naganishia friedmannii]